MVDRMVARLALVIALLVPLAGCDDEVEPADTGVNPPDPDASSCTPQPTFGRFQWSWTVADEPDGCGDKVATVRVIAEQGDSGNQIIRVHACLDRTAFSAELPFGPYVVWVEAIDAGGTTRGASEPRPACLDQTELPVPVTLSLDF
jgi:hypothetical protein